MKHVTVLIGIAVVFFAGPMLLAGEPESESPKTSEATTEQLHSHMQKMQEQMQRIRATNDPTEREQMMREHMQTMHEGMAIMASMEVADMHMMRNTGDTDMRCTSSQTHAEDMSCQQMGAMEGQHHDREQCMQMMQESMEHPGMEEKSSK
ncbi:MAG: hypothetical protein GTO41_03690 [Burkholderiales bacterium]|nr:hypothetical protein [Burkholderiales bacterium]